MPQTHVSVFRETDGSVPVAEFLEMLERQRFKKAHSQCLALILELGSPGT